MPPTVAFKSVVLHKANGTTITYNRVTEILHESATNVVFTDEKFGRISSNMPYQVKFSPLSATEERAQA
jgi:hypothetical protein